jgi:predicted kinase
MDTRKLKHILNTCSQPYILMLVGPPLSGKDTALKEMNLDAVMISRDQILMDVYGSDNYDEAFKNVNQKEVDRVLLSKMMKASSEGKNVVINMTNMTRKRRITNLSYFGDEYYKIALIFPILDESEYERRNLKRKAEEQKFIPPNILKNMISSYQTIDKSVEGFDKVISL